MNIDFTDSFHRAAAMRAKGITLCSYLITLAAVQRGLRVAFVYNAANHSPRFVNAHIQGVRGEMFKISDGATSHVFSRSMGDLVSEKSDRLTEYKQQTKSVLERAGLNVPEGISVKASNKRLVDQFLAIVSNSHFVIKPSAGSLSKDTRVNLTKAEVHNELLKRGDDTVVLERYVVGKEYRIAVVGSECVAVSFRRKPSITGDGVSAVSTLIERLKAQLSQNNPHWTGFADQKSITSFIARQGYAFDQVLPHNTRLKVTETADGVAHQDVTDEFEDRFKEQAVKAAQALKLPNCGLDAIVTNDGEIYFLEVNQRAYIGAHSFPSFGSGRGNLVAEKIIDHYFPASKDNIRHPDFAYDISPIKDALMSGQVASVDLPLLGKDDRVIRKKFQGPNSFRDVVDLYNHARRIGLFAFPQKFDELSSEICIAGDRRRISDLKGCV